MLQHKKCPFSLWFLILFITSQKTFSQEFIPQKISFIGSGYVGLVTGACLAECGHSVICADIDTKKIKRLNKGIIPIYEPGLDTIVSQNISQKRLFFTSNLKKTIQETDIIFVAVGTPFNQDTGEVDLSYIFSVMQEIAQHINSYKIIVIKSTVPVGTQHKISKLLVEKYNIDSSLFDIVSNPEFLREGTAVDDTFHPDRIVIGATSVNAQNIIRNVYSPISKESVPIIYTNCPTAEMIKYASNSFLATKIAFINEIANICHKTGCDISTISHAMGLDPRIGKYFLKPGPGFGGSCLPKDTKGIVSIATQEGISVPLLEGVITSNEKQQQISFKMITDALGLDLTDKTISILGLAFKAETDDIRFTPAIPTIKALLQAGATIKAYDPAANENMKAKFPTVTYCKSAEHAIQNSDCVIILTEWEEFKTINWKQLSSNMHNKLVIDMRNIVPVSSLIEQGITVLGIAVHATDS